MAMPIFARLWTRYVRKLTWHTPLLVLLFVFSTSWALMALVETTTDIADPRQYWWWFLITSSTVGYGDVYPETTAGRVVGAYVVLGGVITLTTLFTHLADRISRAKGRRMKGLVSHDLTGHVVLLGYTPGRTDRIARDLVGDARTAGHHLDVVICAWEDQVENDPLPEDVDAHFVRGDLADLEVLRRAAIDGSIGDPRGRPRRQRGPHTDGGGRGGGQRRPHRGDAARPRPAAHDPPHRRHRPLRAVARRRHGLRGATGPRHRRRLRGADDAGGTSTWSSPVPDGSNATYGAWQRALGETHGATLLAIRSGADGVAVSAPWATPVPEGALLYYVGERRLSPDELARLLG